MSNAINTDTYFFYYTKEAKFLIFCSMLIILPCRSFSGCKSSHPKHLRKHSIPKSASVLTLVRACRLLFSNRAKQRPIPSISASDSSESQFHIYFRSFRSNFLSIFQCNKCKISHKSSTLIVCFRVRQQLSLRPECVNRFHTVPFYEPLTHIYSLTVHLLSRFQLQCPD